MQIRAVDIDVITIETKPGEIISIRQNEDGIKIKTVTSSFLIRDGRLAAAIEKGQLLIIQRKDGNDDDKKTG